MEKGKALTLYELNSIVREVLETAMPDSYWVQAELSEVRENNGHCYMELIQKDERNNTPVAKASAKCWRNRWMLVRPYFERITGQHIHSGMKVMLQVHPQFHENYGFSWIVDDINPEFTMGDMARKRIEIINQLKEEGVFELQKELKIPMFCQRIAVISSANAAGYGDFCNQLEDNNYGLKFYTKLFPAIMQGEQVEQSVIAALNAINEEIDDFDVVVIIRGGGATSDMSGFDTLSLAENVANFPLPIITGIGHERDESVLDMISNTRVKTPTAAAAFLVENLSGVYERVEDAQEAIAHYVKRRMAMERMKLEKLSSRIPILFSVARTREESLLDMRLDRIISLIQKKIDNQFYRIETLSSAIVPAINKKIMKENYRQKVLEERIKALDPQNILKRGYSITLHQGKAVRDASALETGDEIETKVYKGSIKSIVN